MPKENDKDYHCIFAFHSPSDMNDFGKLMRVAELIECFLSQPALPFNWEASKTFLTSNFSCKIIENTP
jgi:hypothetical protein